LITFCTLVLSKWHLLTAQLGQTPHFLVEHIPEWEFLALPREASGRPRASKPASLSQSRLSRNRRRQVTNKLNMFALGVLPVVRRLRLSW
jgi:hypothetical protein